MRCGQDRGSTVTGFKIRAAGVQARWPAALAFSRRILQKYRLGWIGCGFPVLYYLLYGRRVFYERWLAPAVGSLLERVRYLRAVVSRTAAGARAAELFNPAEIRRWRFYGRTPSMRGFLPGITGGIFSAGESLRPPPLMFAAASAIWYLTPGAAGEPHLGRFSKPDVLTRDTSRPVVGDPRAKSASGVTGTGAGARIELVRRLLSGQPAGYMESYEKRSGLRVPVAGMLDMSGMAVTAFPKEMKFKSGMLYIQPAAPGATGPSGSNRQPGGKPGALPSSVGGMGAGILRDVPVRLGVFRFGQGLAPGIFTGGVFAMSLRSRIPAGEGYGLARGTGLQLTGPALPQGRVTGPAAGVRRGLEPGGDEMLPGREQPERPFDYRVVSRVANQAEIFGMPRTRREITVYPQVRMDVPVERAAAKDLAYPGAPGRPGAGKRWEVPGDGVATVPEILPGLPAQPFRLPAEVDLSSLADRVYGLIERKIRIERERRGRPCW